MFRDAMQLSGLSGFAVAGLVLFFVVFVLVVLNVLFGMNRDTINQLKNLPLHPGDAPDPAAGQPHATTSSRSMDHV